MHNTDTTISDVQRVTFFRNFVLKARINNLLLSIQPRQQRCESYYSFDELKRIRHCKYNYGR